MTHAATLSLAPIGRDVYDWLVAICVATVVARNAVAVGQLGMAWWATWREARPTLDSFDLWQRTEARAPRITVIAPADNEELSIAQSPFTLQGIRNQRTRWQQGGLQVLFKHRAMLFNPRYGRLGMVAFPLFALEDLIGSVVELLGYLLMAVGLALGILDPEVPVVYFLLTCVFGSVMSAGVLMIEERQLRPVHAVRDLGWLLIAAVVENFGYRQLIQYYRLRGVKHFLQRKTAWAAVQRGGLGGSAKPGGPAARPAGERRVADLSIDHRRNPGEPPAA